MFRKYGFLDPTRRFQFDRGCGLGGRVCDGPPLPSPGTWGVRQSLRAAAALARGGALPSAPGSVGTEAGIASGSPQATVAEAQVSRPVLCHTVSINVAKFYWIRRRGLTGQPQA